MGKVQDTVNRITPRRRHNAASPIALVVPSRSTPDEQSFPTSFSAVAARLSEQISAPYAEQLIGLTQALTQSNRLTNTATERLKIVTLLRTQVDAMLPALQQQIDAATLPYNAAAGTAFKCITRLQQELAFGYKIALVDVLLRHSGLHRLDRTHATYYAMRFLGDCALQYTAAHQHWPDTYWRDINTLYWLAEQQQTTTETVSSAASEETVYPPTIAGLYATIAMIYLSDSQQLSAKHISQLTSAFAQQAAHMKLQTRINNPFSALSYSVALNGTTAPSLHRYCRYHAKDQVRFLDLSRVSSMLTQMAPAPPDVHLCLQKVVQRWSQHRPRRKARRVSNQTAIVRTGLPDCRTLLQQPEQQHGMVSRKSTWQIINQSDTGLCLQGRPDTNACLTVGELIVCRPKQKNQSVIYTGVIRWIKASPKAGVTMGVELPGVGGWAVVCKKGSDNSVQELQALPAILLDTASDKHTSILLLQGSDYQPGDRLSVTAAVQNNDPPGVYEVVRSVLLDASVTGFELKRQT